MEQKGTTEDKMVGEHNQLKGHKFELELGDGKGQGCLASTVYGITKCKTRMSD